MLISRFIASRIQVWNDDLDVVLEEHELHLFPDTSMFSVALVDGLLVAGMPEASHIGWETGSVVIWPSFDAEPFRIFDAELRSEQRVGEVVASDGRRVAAISSEGLWLFEPDESDPAW